MVAPILAARRLALGLVDELGGEHEARAWLAANKQVATTVPIDDLNQQTWFQRNIAKPNSLLGVFLGLGPVAMAKL